MNRITGIVLLALNLVVLERPALGQSNCKDAKGTVYEVFIGGDSSGGPLKNGGWLDGTVLFVYNIPGVYPTPDPNKITFGATFTLTTNQGQVKGKAVFLVDFVTPVGPSIVNIDPAASTGVFAGATGFLFVNTVKATLGPPPNYYLDLVGGQVCFAR